MKVRIILLTFIFSLIGALIFVQTNIALALASDPDNPITSAITSAINAITNIDQPAAAANSSPAPSATASPTPSSNPLTSPVTQTSPNPSVNSNPITSPVLNSPSSSAAPIASPSATPVPSAPRINTLFPNPATWGTHVVITGANITNSVQIYIDDSLITPLSYSSASQDGTSITFTMPLFTNHRANQTYKVSVKENGVKSNEVNFTVAPSLAYNTSTPSAKQILIDPQVNLDANRSEVLMAYSNFNTNISIPSSVANPTLNFKDILIPNPITNEKFTNFNNALSISANTTLGTIKVEIPTMTQITGPFSWDGIINAPRFINPAGIKPAADAGKAAITSSVIEVGLGDTPLIFDRAVRILIPAQAGKLAGYQRGSDFTKITRSCSADTQNEGDNLPPAGDCYISSGNDLVIWTKHFTKFVTYTQSSQSANNSTSSSGSGSSGPVQAPVCGDSKPVSAPKLVFAKNTGRNEVTLVWTKALDPVSYYLVAYGTKAGVMEYGNPNIGPKDTISYVVKGLDNGKTYYFRIRAGNGCMPGEYSNEMAVKVAGDAISGPAKGFKSGVLASVKKDPAFQPVTQAKPAPRMIKGYNSIFKRLFVFVRGFFDFL